MDFSIDVAEWVPHGPKEWFNAVASICGIVMFAVWAGRGFVRLTQEIWSGLNLGFAIGAIDMQVRSMRAAMKLLGDRSRLVAFSAVAAIRATYLTAVIVALGYLPLDPVPRLFLSLGILAILLVHGNAEFGILYFLKDPDTALNRTIQLARARLSKVRSVDSESKEVVSRLTSVLSDLENIKQLLQAGRDKRDDPKF